VTRAHRERLIVPCLALGALLTAVACIAPRFPYSSPYEATAERGIIPGCAEVQCFRVLVPWVLRLVPLVSVVKWKAYAIVCQVLAGVAVSELCLVLGLSARIAMTALSLSVLSFASMFAMWDPFNADPLMFSLGPAVTAWLLEYRYLRTAVVTAITVLAKEFVVMVVAIVCAWAAWNREWRRARVTFLIAGGAFVLWAAFQILLMRLFDYSYNGSGTAPATNLLSGSFLAVWIARMPPLAALASVFNEFGAVYFLIPFGWLAAPRVLKQLSLAAVPFAAFLAYVEQPDRALSNFHFLACPLGAIALDDAPAAARWSFVALYALAAMRAGAQLNGIPPARFSLAASSALAAAAIVVHLRAAPTRALHS